MKAEECRCVGVLIIWLPVVVLVVPLTLLAVVAVVVSAGVVDVTW